LNKLLRNFCGLVVLSVFLIQNTAVVDASWGLNRLVQQQEAATQKPSTSYQQAPVTNNQPQNATKMPQSRSNNSTADLILSMRNRQPKTIQNTENTSTTNTTKTTNTSNTYTPQPTNPTTNTTSQGTLEIQMLQLINSERKSKGLEPLKWHSELAGVAKLKSDDIVTNNYFAHNSPTYGNFYSMVRNAGISYSQVGENLAKARDINKAHIMLMGSEGHRNNILSSNFTHIGIGITNESNGIVITQLFIK